ncbi:MAG: MFS transporter [Oscillospiraceae bacterium]
MDNSKLFNRNFTLMIIGQIISLFGNVALRFSLSLYVLDATGSAGIFATILAVSTIPTILLSPIGGVLADRVSRQKIMWVLDFTTSAVIILLSFLIKLDNVIITIGIVMVILSTIQCFYQPSVQSSIPLLQNEKNLMKANGIAMQVNAVANLVGPILGGFLYGFFGLKPILYVSAICFFASAVMEIFIKIPFEKRERKSGVVRTVFLDLKEGFSFLKLHDKVLLNGLILIALINLFIATFFQVGSPYIVKIFLGLSSQLYGFVEAALGVGTILGAICSSFLAPKKKISKIYILIILSSLSLLPIIFGTINANQPMISYVIILLSTLFAMIFASVFSIVCQTIMQRSTPAHLLGKTSSFVTTLCICCFPIGQALYGFLFEKFPDEIPVIVAIAVLGGCIVGFASRKTFRWYDENRPEDFSKEFQPEKIAASSLIETE